MVLRRGIRTQDLHRANLNMDFILSYRRFVRLFCSRLPFYRPCHYSHSLCAYACYMLLRDAYMYIPYMLTFQYISHLEYLY